MPMVSVDIRGKSVLVWMQDHGYETDTNSHTIEWDYVNQKDRVEDLTDEESEAIDMQLYEIAGEYHGCDDDVI